ncbi:MAG: hypothetical protein QOH06_5697 [Acidobacteriota bacterium]|jgi:hypothetical protein|nr:hypothetical protein [Acidobacteriota bacterium]
MGLQDKLERNWLGSILIVTVLVAGGTWSALNELLVRPRDEEFARLQRRLEELEANEKGRSHVPELRSTNSSEVQPTEAMEAPRIETRESPSDLSSPSGVETEIAPVEKQTANPSQSATMVNAGSSPSIAPSATHAAIPGPHVVVRDPFRFTLNECIHAVRAQRVRCRLLVENLSSSKQPLVFNPTYATGGRISFLVTEDGTQYRATSNRSAVAAAFERSPKFVPGVAIAVDLIFSGITRKLGSATLVVEADKGQLGKEFTVKFPPIVVGEE